MVTGHRDGLFGRPMEHIFGDRGNHQGGAEHELVVDGEGLPVGGKIHRQTPHDGGALAGDLPPEGVDVGHQPVPESVELHEDIAEGAEFPDLAGRLRSVGPEDWAKGPELEHAGVELLVRGVLAPIGENAAIAAQHEGPDIESPVRDTRHAVVQSRRNLLSVNLPTGADIARPSGGGRPLLAGKDGPGENVDSFGGRFPALVGVD